jgi:glutamyl/glutaminyl-tRNA synthetase
LSKRHGATSVMAYAAEGYLPEAMINFLALLGWSPGAADQELFTRDELTGRFEIEGINRANAVFNPAKLDWFNQQHLLRLAPEDLAHRLQPFLEAAGLWDDAYLGDRHAWFFAVIELLKPRATRLKDFVALGRYFFSDALEYDEAAVRKYLRVEGMGEHLNAMNIAFERQSFDTVMLEVALRSVAEARGVKAAALIHAIRVAVTGMAASPGLFEVLALLGRERTQTRILKASRGLSLPHD